MTDRSRFRVGRMVAYQPTAAEASAGGGNVGDIWAAKITAVDTDESEATLTVYEADGGTLAVSGIKEGAGEGTFAFTGLGPQTP